MKTRTTRLLFIAGMLLSPLLGGAQNTEVQFTYDACGNRIMRSLGFKKIEENGRNVEDRNALLSFATEQMCETKVGLYPNPTEGRFAVVLSKSPGVPVEATLATASGVIIDRQQFSGLQHDFDLSSRSSGVYILKLILGDETRTWKIIKQ